jgi:hypothetical protein
MPETGEIRYLLSANGSSYFAEWTGVEWAAIQLDVHPLAPVVREGLGRGLRFRRVGSSIEAIPAERAPTQERFGPFSHAFRSITSQSTASPLAIVDPPYASGANINGDEFRPSLVREAIRGLAIQEAFRSSNPLAERIRDAQEQRLQDYGRMALGPSSGVAMVPLEDNVPAGQFLTFGRNGRLRAWTANLADRPVAIALEASLNLMVRAQIASEDVLTHLRNEFWGVDPPLRLPDIPTPEPEKPRRSAWERLLDDED